MTNSNETSKKQLKTKTKNTKWQKGEIKSKILSFSKEKKSKKFWVITILCGMFIALFINTPTEEELEIERQKELAAETKRQVEELRKAEEIARREAEHKAWLVEYKKELIARPVSARELLKQYHNNEIEADLNHKGNLISVKGWVEGVEKDFSGNAYIKIAARRSRWELEHVWCYLKDEYVLSDSFQATLKLNKGERVQVLGRVKGMIMQNVIMNNCSVVVDGS